jgi:hypothetical protein
MNNVDAIKMLLSFGASPTAVNGNGKRPIDICRDPESKTVLAGTPQQYRWP